MFNYSFRVFISYRGCSEGEAFGHKLYEYMTNDPTHEKRYGRIYFAPITQDPDVNFKKEVANLMQDVEYFIMPLSQNYYSGFWNQEKDCPNEDSITYQEIKEAIARNCRFICITFPDFTLDEMLLKKLFGEHADELLCLAPLKYSIEEEQAIFKKLCDVLDLKGKNLLGLSHLLHSIEPNVFLSFKKETEDPAKFPFYETLYGVKRITLVNIASSTFISGSDIASTYKEHDPLKQWFDHHLCNGDIEVNIVLNNPHSHAAQDAALYKMYPAGLSTPKDEIILRNMNKLFQFTKRVPSARLNIYLTDIVLPYGLMIMEYENAKNNHIKVDLYSPVISDDKMRPSFYLLQHNPNTAMSYSFFEENAKFIMKNHSFAFKGMPPVSWLLEKPFAHRGVVKTGLLAHTQEAYDACLIEKHPIEADLIILKDGAVVVGRREQQLAFGGVRKLLSDCSLKDLREYNTLAGSKRIFTLAELLDYVGGKVPLLLEIKTDHLQTSAPTKQKEILTKQIFNIVKNYMKSSFCFHRTADGISSHRIAFHSADPFVLKTLKELDCTLPCGIISMDFSKISERVGEPFVHMHAAHEYVEFFSPDFVSYCVQDLNDMTMKNFCEERKIPLLGWTVTNETEKITAFDYGCQNIIVEKK